MSGEAAGLFFSGLSFGIAITVIALTAREWWR